MRCLVKMLVKTWLKMRLTVSDEAEMVVPQANQADIIVGIFGPLQTFQHLLPPTYGLRLPPKLTFKHRLEYTLKNNIPGILKCLVWWLQTLSHFATRNTRTCKSSGNEH